MHFYTTKNVYIIRMNRIFRKIFKLIPAVCCTGLLSAKEISIINWNLQTFFDANKDGCEYKEFQKSEKWNKDAYQKRLDRLCTFMNQSNADMIFPTGWQVTHGVPENAGHTELFTKTKETQSDVLSFRG